MKSDYYDSRKYITPHVGGINLSNKNQINNQKRILNEQLKRESYSHKTFDPENNYLKSHGLEEQNSPINLKYNYVNINSSDRNKLPSVDISDTTLLEQNPLMFSLFYFVWVFQVYL